MDQTILELQDYVTDNELALALTKLRSIFSIADSDLVNDAIIVSGQLKKWQSDVRKGIIGAAEQNLRHNRIMDSILSLIDEIKQEPTVFEAYIQAQEQLDESVQDKGQAELPVGVKNAFFERITRVKEQGIQLKAIWIDDFPINNLYERRMLHNIGVEVECATSSAEARQLLDQQSYAILISDVAREGTRDEGLRFHQELVENGLDLPTIFYTGQVERSKGVPPYAFGIADLPTDLVHLVCDIIDRMS